MAKASRDVLVNLELRSDVQTIRFPDRFSLKRGEDMSQRVLKILVNPTTNDLCAAATPVLHGRTPVQSI